MGNFCLQNVTLIVALYIINTPRNIQYIVGLEKNLFYLGLKMGYTYIQY